MPCIPAFVNPASGTSGPSRDALAADARFDLRETDASALADALRGCVDEGVPRVLVSGGDGTLALAAGVLAGTGTALAVLPGGTLNHFAHAHALPLLAADALDVAANGSVCLADAARLGERLFLNTSSVGAYTTFASRRERAERWLPYRLASIVAAVWTAASYPVVRARVTVDGAARVIESPILFVGVGERDLSAEGRGLPCAGGARALHLVAPQVTSRWALLRLAWRAATHGIPPWTTDPDVQSVLADTLDVEFRRGMVRVALDGELTERPTPLHYAYARDALRLCMPPTSLPHA